ncbi:MAG: hypothetical protein Fur0019_19360 [Tibeticola sp.]
MAGAAQRILAMAEAEQRQRHAIEQTQSKLQQDGVRLAARDSMLGSAAGLVGLLSSLGVGLTAYLHGADWRIVTVFCGPAITMVLVELVRRGRR